MLEVYGVMAYTKGADHLSGSALCLIHNAARCMTAFIRRVVPRGQDRKTSLTEKRIAPSAEVSKMLAFGAAGLLRVS